MKRIYEPIKIFTMNFQRITKLQKIHGYTDIQNKINSGLCWKFEGSVGRLASDLLYSGVCMLPKVIRLDYYGSKVPSRNILLPGTKGTYQNSVNFWNKFEDGEIEFEF